LKLRVLLLAAGLALHGAPFAQAATTARIDTSGAPVTLRSGPGTQYGGTGSAVNGQFVTITCTTSSEPVTGRYGTTAIWDRLGDGSWVADAFVYTGTSGRVEPECAPTGARPAGDDYPYAGSRPNSVDRWALLSRQCTSWVGWRMEQLTGYFHNYMWHNGVHGHWGNARDWNDNARQLGYPVDHVPRPGAIAQWEPNAGGASSMGHVAYISAVTGTDVTVEEYNWTVSLGFGTRTVPLEKISFVIHFAAGT
jgi:surface antigen